MSFARVLIIAACLLPGLACAPGTAPPVASPSDEIVVRPAPYDKSLRNPLKGFVMFSHDGKGPYSTLSEKRIPWKDIESSADDGVDKIVAFTNERWKGIEDLNIKLIIRIIPENPIGSEDDPYWPTKNLMPADMTLRDYTSAKFRARAKRLIEKMAAAWDNDPRVAYIQMGLIGPWGEQHHPAPTEAMQKVMGNAFAASFKNKLVMNRYPWHFEDYDFGIYWDSFGNPGWEMRSHVPILETRLSERWKTAPMGGEAAFDSGMPRKTGKPPAKRLGKDPTDALANNSDLVLQYIHRWHWNMLGWISRYDANVQAAEENAQKVQSALGYNFVIDEFRYPRRVQAGGTLAASFVVRNIGSAPMYYNWPLELSLLEPNSRQVVWKAKFSNLDIRTILPGTFSDVGKGKPILDAKGGIENFQWETGRDYDIPARPFTISGQFHLPSDLPRGRYILAVAILDPAGDLPSARFATANYFTGGRHPIGIIGVGCDNPDPQLDPKTFDDPATDTSLHYLVTNK